MERTYYRHKLKNLLVINKIVTTHYLELDKGFSSHGEAHDFWEFVYVDKGALFCKRDSEDMILKEGEIVFHKPNEFHVHASDPLSPPHIFVISFECKSEAMRFFENRRLHVERELLKYVYMIIEESRSTFLIPVSDPMIKKMPLRPTLPIGSLQLIKNLLEILLIRLMRDETENENTSSVFLSKEEFDNRIANRIKAHLKEHIHTSLSIDELATMMNYNKSYLFRQFKASTGQTIMSYFAFLKIEEAKKTLAQTDMTVSQIAALYAFDTPNYFSKVFKRMTGISPLTYRKMNRKTKPNGKI
ncbi:MAG: helix-turn-helix transcriptional regulator [Ruminococcaceae bacterium]|nr:helix-turn-helix transcriptional regulator [Oscillospiraceae bacterium]